MNDLDRSNQIYTKPVKIDYYTSAKRKLIDFCLGVFGVGILIYAYFAIDDALIYQPNHNSLIFSIGCIILYLVGVFCSFAIKRKFITYGLIIGIPIFLIAWILLVVITFMLDPHGL